MTKKLKTGWPFHTVNVIIKPTLGMSTYTEGNTVIGRYVGGHIWPIDLLSRGHIEILEEYMGTPLIMHEVQHVRDGLNPLNSFRRIYWSRARYRLWLEVRAEAMRIWYTPHGDKAKAIWDHSLHLAQTFNKTREEVETMIYNAGIKLGFSLYSEFNAESPPWV